ncbi:MAG: peptidoglycan-binding domain-containing protein [Candidatus Omnitrophica bacterium]|nr:peptidoglycan-binding domain-containing protein [Candidatus Omnitrophota bacterium]
MRRFLVLSVMVIFALCAFGCSKKQPAMEEGQESMSTSSLPSDTSASMQQGGVTTQTTATEAPGTAATAMTETKTEPPLPPSGPFKPAVQEIQTALKNAGFYTGEVDGKLGPKTKKAIEEFQAAHNLKADGKVGSQTWAVLQGSLNTSPAAKETKKGKKR